MFDDLTRTALAELAYCDLHDAETAAVAAIEARYATVSTRSKVALEVSRFFRHARAHGLLTLDEVTSDFVLEFCWSAVKHRGEIRNVSMRTAANRQSFLRTAFRELRQLGLLSDDPTGEPIARCDSSTSRPLTEDELRRVRTRSMSGLSAGRGALLVAFSEAGGSAAEIAAITLDDVDLAGGRVWLGGPNGRSNVLNEWGSMVVADYLRWSGAHPTERLCVDETTSVDRAAHSVTVRLATAIREARLSPGVTARSIRLGVARQVLETSGLEAAARFLGQRSLDATAAALQYSWWETA